MTTKQLLLFQILLPTLLLCPCASSAPPERIAVAEISAKGGFDAASASGLAERIEAKLGGSFEVITRSALKSMMAEAAFQQESGLVADGERIAKLASVHGVKYLLATTIAKIGSKLSMTVMVVDCTTGRIDPDRRVALEADDVDGILSQLDGALARIGLLHRESSSGLKRLALMPATAAQGVKSEAADALGERLDEFLLKSGSFELVERERGGRNSPAKPDSSCDWYVEVKLQHLDENMLASGTAIAGVSVRRAATLGLELRIVDARTGTLVAVENVTCRRGLSDIPADVRRDWTVSDYRDDLMEHAAEQAGRRLLERLDPVLVAAVDGRQLYLTRGEGSGVRPGQIYEIFLPGRTLIHPKTKQTIGTMERRLGTARIDSTAANMSIATLQENAQEAVIGARCRLLSDAPAEAGTAAAPAYPAATP